MAHSIYICIYFKILYIFNHIYSIYNIYLYIEFDRTLFIILSLYLSNGISVLAYETRISPRRRHE